jgi:hypothetical protein
VSFFGVSVCFDSGGELSFLFFVWRVLFRVASFVFVFGIGFVFVFVRCFGVSCCRVVVVFFYESVFVFGTKNPTRVWFVSGVSFSVGQKFNIEVPAIGLFVPNNCF